MTDTLQVLKTYPDYIKANLDIQILKNAGIFAMLYDEHTVTMNWLYGNAIGGIKLMVPESDYLKAADILEAIALEAEQAKKEPLDEELELSFGKENKICPKCGSRNTQKLKLNRSASLFSIIFFGFPLVIGTKKYFCFHCSEEFETK